MKRIILFSSVMFLISCNPTQEKIAQKIIKTYCIEQSNINGYNPIIFSSLDSAFTSFENTLEYKRYSNLKGISDFIEHSDGQYDDLKQEQWYQDSILYYENLCDSLKSIFVPDFIGWKMGHIYKSKNDKGDELVNYFVFYFDKDLMKVSNTKQIYQKLPMQSYEQDPVFHGIK